MFTFSQAKSNSTMAARIALIFALCWLTLAGSSYAASAGAAEQPLELEASLFDATGMPLHGPQNVILRLAVEPDGEVLFESRHTTELFIAESMLLSMPNPVVVDHGKMRMSTRPAPHELESYDFLWLTFEIDGWIGEPQPVFVQDGIVHPLDAEDIVSRLEPPARAAAEMQLPAKLVSSDPSIHAPYTGGLCSWNWTCAGVKGRFRWMRHGGASCWSNPAPDMPLVVILHGNGYDEDEYDYLQNHLAANGMLSLSLDVIATSQVTPDSQDHQDAADDAEAYLNSACFDGVIDNFTDSQAVDLSQTALVGHSRGGETVRYLADNLFSNAKFTTRAVVSMAPTRHTSETLYGFETPAYMVLGATHDGDVDPHGVFRAHDWGGYNEYSTPTANDLDRSMKLFLDGEHAGFSDRSNLVPAPQQRSTTQGYVNAFLRAWLLNDWQFYTSYIRGNEVPGSWSYGIGSQFSTRTARKVIDNFQNGNTGLNTLGDSVFSTNTDIFAEANGSTLATTPHAARGLRIRPDGNNATVIWDIPAGQRDFSSYLYLSLRVGRLTGSGPLNLRVGVRNGGVFSWAYLNDFGGIPDPFYFCVDSCQLGGGDTLGYMQTFRIPVGSFSGTNDIDRVYLQFLGGSAIGDEFFVDNLEFADTFFIVPL